jgi:predicted unusual protein kinase regulating ubiquinone biosynthesis (AarF/ABC1/UbiB family)
MPVVREAIRQNKQNNSHCVVPIKDPLLDRMNSVQKAAFIERYGLYTANHPLTKFLRSLPIAKANPDIEIFVTKRLNEPNAVSFPDGTVFISDRMIDFCEYREELEYVLSHEIRHISATHSEKRMAETDVISALGRSRIHEYEADLAHLFKEGQNAPINPFGGIVFLERMAQRESRRNLSSDMAHGGTYDRLINVEYSTRIIDQEALTSQLNTIPESLRKKSRSKTDLWRAFEKIDDKHLPRMLRAAKNMDLNGAAQFWSKVYLSDLDPDNKDKVLLSLSQTIKTNLKGLYPNSSEDTRKTFAAFLIFSQVNIDPLNGFKKTNQLSADLAHRVVQSDILFSEFIDMLNNIPSDFPITFDKNNLGRFLSSIIIRLSKDSLDESGFQLAKKMRASLMHISPKGLGENIDIKFATFLLKMYGKDKLREYFERIEEEGIQVDKNRLFSMVCRHLKLTEDEKKKVKEEFFSDLKEKKEERKIKIAEVQGQDRSRDDIEKDFMKIVAGIFKQVSTFDELVELLNKCDNGKNEDGQTMIYAIYCFPEMFLEQVKIEFGINEFTNKQAMDLYNSIAVDSESWFALLLLHRRFSFDELKMVKKLLTIEIESFKRIVINHLNRIEDRDEYFEMIDFLIRNKLFEYKGLLLPNSIEVFIHAMERFSFDLNCEEECDQLLSMTVLLPDPNLRLRLQKSVLDSYVSLLDNDATYELLFKDKRISDYASAEARERYINGSTKKPAQLRRINEYVMKRIEGVRSKKAATYVISEKLTDELVKDKEGLFKALLNKGSNEPLRLYLTEAYLRALEHLHNERNNLDFNREAELLIPPAQTEELLYNLDHEARIVLVNRLLLGSDGVLVNQKSRVRMMRWFFQNFIEEPKTESEQTVYEFLELAFEKVAEKSDVSTLFFLIQPMVVERILGQSVEKADWEGVLSKAKKNIKIRTTRKREGRAFIDFIEENGVSIVNGVMELVYPENPDPLGDANNKGDHLISATRLCSNYIQDVPETVHEMGAIEFVKHLSSNLGAPGVRFLQSLGIYADLPPELRRQFDEVYDNVKGQLKLSAYHTLEKNWNGGTKLEEELDELGERIGGGSLVTVYKGSVKGQKKVVKVVNPNVQYRAERICDNLCDIFSSDERLARGVPLIENIRTWIAQDVSFESAELAQTFKEQNDGFSVPDNEYSIWVPDVHKQEKKFVVEDFVDGTNLTDWEAIEQNHDVKQIVSLIVKNALNQLSKGVVHADIHVGNIRVTEDKQVALLDKNYLLVLSEHDRSFLASLTLVSRNKPALAKAIGEYLCSFEENKNIDQDKFISQLTDILVANGHRDVGSLISDCVSIISKQNGIIPLNVMLLVKNALALERMAKRAGFENILDAFKH